MYLVFMAREDAEAFLRAMLAPLSAARPGQPLPGVPFSGQEDPGDRQHAVGSGLGGDRNPRKVRLSVIGGQRVLDGVTPYAKLSRRDDLGLASVSKPARMAHVSHPRTTAGAPPS
jgi:hypothetical protein